MNSPIEEIKQAVAENRTSDALSRLLELTQSNKQLHDAVHIVLAKFNDLTSQRLKFAAYLLAVVISAFKK